MHRGCSQTFVTSVQALHQERQQQQQQLLAQGRHLSPFLQSGARGGSRGAGLFSNEVSKSCMLRRTLIVLCFMKPKVWFKSCHATVLQSARMNQVHPG